MNLLAGDLDSIIADGGDLWEALRGRRVFITGGTGFFGCWLLETFCWANRTHGLGATATVLTRDPAAFARKTPHLVRDPAVTSVTGDVRRFDIAELRRQRPAGGDRFDFFIHAATEASAALLAEAPLLMLDTVVQGTRAALDLAVATGAGRFLLTSSGAVYGRQPGELTHVGETYAGAPESALASSAYGEGKRLAETMCGCFHARYGLEATIARCFAFVGPYLPLDAHFAIGNFIRDAIAGDAIRISGDGTPVRSYLYAGDLARWLWTILLRGVAGRPYNVGSGEDLSIAALAARVVAALASGADVRIATRPVPGAEVHRYVPDVSRAASELGLVQRVALDEAVRRTASWELRMRQTV